MTDELTTGPVPAAEGSVIASLRDRRAKAKAGLYLDLKVPRYDPEIFVRFKPLDQPAIQAAAKRVEKSKDPEMPVVANAGLLAKACVGVFEVVNGEEVSVAANKSTDPDDWPKFDKNLAELLGEPDLDRSADVIRALYCTDGDILSTAAKLAEWSGYANDELDRETEGN